MKEEKVDGRLKEDQRERERTNGLGRKRRISIHHIVLYNNR